jgi:hypothetical protein
VRAAGPAFALACLCLVVPARSADLVGDLMGSGQPEVSSAVRILRVVAGIDAPPSAGDLWKWDCNKSGAVDAGDAAMIMRCVVGLDTWPIPGGPMLTNLFFLHHSVGANLVEQGNVRANINAYNTAHGTSFVFWDHGYNGDGLRDPAGDATGTNYDIPDDNTDVGGLYALWTSTESNCVTCRNKILADHQVIAFKSCFPNSQIEDDAMLQQYKSWYLQMRDFFDTRRDKLFIVMFAPPLHRLSNDPAWAARARAFATWLGSPTYLSGHPNVRCFNLFDAFARADDGTATANMLKYAYEGSHSDGDSHPNELANQTVGPVFARFLCDAAAGYTP